MEAWRIEDLHAYVDDCLDPDERQTFEEQMAQDLALARRAALWRAQSSAIRAAFDGEGAKAFSISIVRHQHEVLGRGKQSVAGGGRPSCDEPMHHFSATIADAARFSAKIVAPDASRSSLLWRLAVGALFLGLAFFWAPAAMDIPGERLAEAGIAAFQAFVRPGVEPFEFATSDRAEAQAWLARRLMHPVTLPETPSAIRMVGVRIAPYPNNPAAFLVYQSEDRHVGLLIQSLDAPATKAPQLFGAAVGHIAAIWIWSGQGFALVGLNDASLLKVATDFFDPPLKVAQIPPGRGW
jgi:anti-sigma factor RsiW